MVVFVGRTAALSCCGLRSPSAAFESMAGRLASQQRAKISAAICAGFKPFSTLWLQSNSASRVYHPGGLFNLGRTYYGAGGRGAPSAAPGWSGGGTSLRVGSTAGEVVAYDQYGHGGQPQQEVRRPPLIQWEKDLANAVQLIGNVGKDIDIKYLDSGKVVATTSLAVNKSGIKRNEEPSWFQIELWDELAESAAQYVKKGERIFVVGRIEVIKWVKDEVTYTAAKIVCRDLCFVEAYNDQRPAYGESNVAQQEEVTDMDDSQRNWKQQQQASQPSQVQKGSSSGYEDAALETEKKWQEYFADPTQWWDNRENKRNPRAPDFKHKNTQEALWINSWNNPPWVAQQLGVLEEKKAQHPGGFGDARHRSKEKKLTSFNDSDFLR